jgi:hypothetical protein
MRNVSYGNTVRGAVFAALACSGLVGCSSHHEVSKSQDVQSAYEELQVQLQNCASNALDCVKAANCDDTAEQACRDEFKACRDATRDAYRAFHDAVKDCFGTARQCVENIQDSGAADVDGGVRAAFGACRDQFKMCVADNRPIRPEPGPCCSALRECVQNDENDKRDCFEQAHTCFVNRLPMCGPNEPGGGTGGTGTGAAGTGTGTGGTGTGNAGTGAAGTGAGTGGSST